MLWDARARPDISLRNYTDDQIARFIEEDRLDDEAARIADHFAQVLQGPPVQAWPQEIIRPTTR